ncbi:purine and uridine phosphorylase [Xylaria curta]|nr:purine and uridine phosphorylase [Xylaria curta]
MGCGHFIHSSFDPEHSFIVNMDESTSYDPPGLFYGQSGIDAFNNNLNYNCFEELLSPASATTEAAPVKRFSCTQSGCIKSFTRNADLRRHMSLHQTKPNWAHYCPYKSCHRSKRGFHRHDKLFEHVKRTHDKPELSETDIMIVCALPLEYDAIRLAFDGNWEQDRRENDDSTGTSYPPLEGRVSGYSVILYLFPPPRTSDSMIAAISKHPSVGLVLLVQASEPPLQTNVDDNRIWPGDLVISKTSCRKEIASQVPQERIRMPSNNIQVLLTMLSTNLHRENIQRRIDHFLNKLKVNAGQWETGEEMHSHPNIPKGRDDIHDKARRPAVHIISPSDNSIYFEENQLDRLCQEEVPCIIVEGVSETNGQWDYAITIAASTAKVILELSTRLYTMSQPIVGSSEPQPHWIVPFGRNRDFVGREVVLERLLQLIPPSSDVDDCQRVAIEGLGGIGKTHIAIEAAYRVRDLHSDCSVFWVPGMNIAAFENAYRQIGQALNMQGIDESQADLKASVKTALSADNIGWWLMIIDNADDPDLLFSQNYGPPMRHFLPFSHKGSILFTTRNHEVSARLDISAGSIIIVGEMAKAEAVKMLQNGLQETQLRDVQSTEQLLGYLGYLPLAIRQASAYMARTGITTTTYLKYCRSSDKSQLRMLSQDFEDRHRYAHGANNIIATWGTSFDHISRNWPLAMQHLKLMSYLADRNVPISLLPGDDEIEKDEAIGVLKGYAFVTEKETPGLLNTHRLVQLAMRNWIKSQPDQEEWIAFTIKRLSTVFPNPDHFNRDVWLKYLPHAQSALELRDDYCDAEATWELLLSVGRSHLILGNYSEADRIYRRTLDFAEKVWGGQNDRTLRTLANLKELAVVADKMANQMLELTGNEFG